jgi:hypothetical protein
VKDTYDNVKDKVKSKYHEAKDRYDEEDLEEDYEEG